MTMTDDPIRLAVFDCDGTLVDGQGSICKAMEQAFASGGLVPPQRHDIRRIVGLSLPHAVQRLAPQAPPEIVRHVVDAYKQAFRAARASGELSEPLFDGIAPLLDRLRSAGWLLGVATGKSDRGLVHCLNSHQIADRFITLQTADRHPGKPHPAMLEAALDEGFASAEHAVMIGDTAYDMAMAASIGVRAIGVDWGYHERHELITAGAEFVATSPAELGEYLCR